MSIKLVKGTVMAVGLLAAMVASAGDDKSFSSYYHGEKHHKFDDGGGDDGHKHGSPVPEPSEWVFLGVGLALIGAVAHRRQAKLLSK